MNLKTVYATIAGAIVFFFLGWLVYGVLLMNFFESNTTHYEGLMNEMPNMFLMILSNLVYAFFITYVLQKWAGAKTFGSGFTDGLIIGFLIILGFDLYFLAGMNLFNYTAAIVDIIVYAILTAIVGGVVGWILGTGKKTEAKEA